MIDKLLEKLAEGGPLALIVGFLLFRLDRTLRELRDTVRDSVRSFICRSEERTAGEERRVGPSDRRDL